MDLRLVFMELHLLFFMPQVLLKNEPVHPFGLAVYGDYIFWTDWVRRAVLRADKYTGGDMKVLRADIPQQPMGIVAVANDTNSCEYHHCCNLAPLPSGQHFNLPSNLIYVYITAKRMKFGCSLFSVWHCGRYHVYCLHYTCMCTRCQAANT